MQPTPRNELDRALEVLDDNRSRWAALDIDSRVALLRKMRRETRAAAADWVAAACRLKGIPVDSSLAGEEWLGGPMLTLRNMRLLEKTLGEIRASGRPAVRTGAVRRRADGQLTVRVFPAEPADRLLYGGFLADVWMLPGVGETDLYAGMARAYRGDGERRGAVTAVLGAGNVSSIGPMDVLSKMFVENSVCVLKMHPVNEALGPLVERGLGALVDEGFLRIVYGGAEEGDHLVRHALVDAVHITGSDRVHDAIVWGSGAGGESARRAGTPRLEKPVTSELGCVTPVIIVPGRWSEKEIAYQAQNVATMVANNASFNCNAAKVLITHAGWPQRRRFLEKLAEVFGALPPRRAYYPGSEEKYRSFLEAHPEALTFGERRDGCLPWTLIPSVGQENRDEIAFRVEAWCAIVAETSLPAGDPAEFLSAAVDFANDRLRGTLSCGVVIDPRTEKALASAMDAAVANLRYGSVVVNHWPAISYGLVVTPWGAYPGHTPDDIQSGVGFVHNTIMLERIEKAVVRGPFVVRPAPAWFSTHRKADRVGARLTAFEASPSFWNVARIVGAAIGG